MERSGVHRAYRGLLPPLQHHQVPRAGDSAYQENAHRHLFHQKSKLEASGKVTAKLLIWGECHEMKRVNSDAYLMEFLTS